MSAFHITAKGNNRNTRKQCPICLKLTIATTEQRQQLYQSFFFNKVAAWKLATSVQLLVFFYCFYWLLFTLFWLLLKPGSGPWTRTLIKTWTLKNLDPKKRGINIGLKCVSDFRELAFIKTMRNVIDCLKVRVLTDI